MAKIAVVGSENFTLGFSLVGVDAFSIDKIEKIQEKSDDYGILIIEEIEFNKLNLNLRKRLELSKKPLVITLRDDNIAGTSLRDKIIKSLGIDLMKDN